MRTYYNLHQFILDQLQAQSYIKEVINTDVILNSFEVTNYNTALAVVTITPESSLDNHLIFTVEIDIVDRVDYSNKKTDDYYFGGTNKIDVYNSTLASLRKLHSNIKDFARGSIARKILDQEFAVDGHPTFEKLDDKKQGVAGFTMTMSLRVDDDLTNTCIDV